MKMRRSLAISCALVAWGTAALPAAESTAVPWEPWSDADAARAAASRTAAR